ncbi:hypothetical protein GWI33_012767 [Rhynchophorus ferrugineus]|uniref:C2H2-type domain-containing protein n=1 Tax=Rhynchophorus ferrugineus TaxID=354439 RepID=A0A834MJR5_RHYFE|nr:hypothetical protein GWI33_012767 [Rhynchophorus ferrugineus]
MTVRCDKCGRQYKNAITLKVHLRQDCGKPKRFTCSICRTARRKISEEKYEFHTLSSRRGDGSKDDPGLWPINMTDDLVNILVNRGPIQVFNYNFPPSDNGRKFSDRYYLRKLPNGCQLECPNCHKTYKSSSVLRTHRALDCGREKKFNCTHCNSAFKRKAHLKEHLINKHNLSI